MKVIKGYGSDKVDIELNGTEAKWLRYILNELTPQSTFDKNLAFELEYAIDKVIKEITTDDND